MNYSRNITTSQNEKPWPKLQQNLKKARLDSFDAKSRNPKMKKKFHIQTKRHRRKACKKYRMAMMKGIFIHQKCETR